MWLTRLVMPAQPTQVQVSKVLSYIKFLWFSTVRSLSLSNRLTFFAASLPPNIKYILIRGNKGKIPNLKETGLEVFIALMVR